VNVCPVDRAAKKKGRKDSHRATKGERKGRSASSMAASSGRASSGHGPKKKKKKDAANQAETAAFLGKNGAALSREKKKKGKGQLRNRSFTSPILGVSSPPLKKREGGGRGGLRLEDFCITLGAKEKREGKGGRTPTLDAAPTTPRTPKKKKRGIGKKRARPLPVLRKSPKKERGEKESPHRVASATICRSWEGGRHSNVILPF